MVIIMAIKYKWLCEKLREQINTDMMAGIEKLPSEEELCLQYNLSRQTVRKTLSVLEQEGIIEKRKGSGSYITGRLSDSQRNEIGILISDTENYLYPGLLFDLQAEISGAGFSHRLFPTAGSVSREREILLYLAEHPLRGLVVECCKSALPNPNTDLYRKLSSLGTSIVFLYNKYSNLPDCCSIEEDDFAGSSLLTQYLAKQGHSSIGAIFCLDDLSGRNRYEGFLHTCLDLNLPFSDESIFWYSHRELQYIRQNKYLPALKDFVSKELVQCSAIICQNDEIAYFLIGELESEGFSVPEDMTVVSFDNSYLSSETELSITSLSHKPHDIPRRAMQSLLQKMKGLPAPSQTIPWDLMIRKST